ncbi:MAG: DUF59 domain-containing protein [Alphaproteobacteria bacterium]|nr:DUF59 domain-containing protein [Alphaproteobacteria bacterium]
MENETAKDLLPESLPAEENNIGATESRLLQAMSVDDLSSAAQPEELPEFIAYAGTELSTDIEKAKMIDIVDSIRLVSDPEIPINVYDMGLIYKIEQKDTGDIYIEMTLTAPTCPIAGVLPQQVADAVAGVVGVGKVEVKLVWEPAWTPDKMTDEAKEMLELL